MRVTASRWLAGLLAAWAVAYAAYFALLVLADTLIGGRQLLAEFLFESRHAMALRLVAVVAESAWLVAPVVALAAVFVRAGPGGHGLRAGALRAAACAVLLAALLMAIGMTAVQAAIFALALLAATGASFAVLTTGHRHAH